jgi:ATP-dependent Clp protease protease subunit
MNDNVNDIHARLLRDRIIFLSTVIDTDCAKLVVSQLLYLEAESEKDLYLYINSPGGAVTAGMTIYDTMQQIKPDIMTVCTGIAAGMGAILLTAGTSGKRMALSDSKIVLTPIIRGDAVDSDYVEEVAHYQQKLFSLVAQHTGQPLKKIENDIQKDFFLSPEEAQQYGLIDAIIARSATN